MVWVDKTFGARQDNFIKSKKLVSKTKAWVIASLTKTHQLPQLSLFFFDANAVSSQHAYNCLSFSVSMKVKLLSHLFSCLSGGLKAMPKYFSALPSLPFACSFVIPLSRANTFDNRLTSETYWFLWERNFLHCIIIMRAILTLVVGHWRSLAFNCWLFIERFLESSQK